MEYVYRPVVGVALGLFKLMDWRVHIEGAHHIPRRGPAVIASNHIGYLDFVFVGRGALDAGRLVRFGAKKEVFDHWLAGPLMRGMKHIPVDRFGDVQQVMEEAHRKLRAGEVIGMFPEGTISRSFVPMKMMSGAARMAMRAGAPLVPCAVWGDHRISTKAVHRNLQRDLDIMVAFAEPIPYEPDSDPREVTGRLLEVVRELVARLQEDYPQQPADDADRWWLPAHLGGTAPTPEEAAAIAKQEREAKRRKREGEAGTTA